jgi:hypothetical protein
MKAMRFDRHGEAIKVSKRSSHSGDDRGTELPVGRRIQVAAVDVERRKTENVHVLDPDWGLHSSPRGSAMRAPRLTRILTSRQWILSKFGG